jgi:hypothetical protein
MRKIILALVIAVLMAPAAAMAGITFDVSLISPTLTYPAVLDTGRSAAGTLGFDNWYIWTYQVKVVPGDDTRNALSHWVLELPNCYLASPDLFREIEASATRNSFGDDGKIRVYKVNDEESDLPKDSVLKWDQISGDELDTLGEWAEFQFSVPTNKSIEKDWEVKAGGDIIDGDVRVPSCDGCVPPDPGVPEPASMMLMGIGLFGTALLRKRRGK